MSRRRAAFFRCDQQPPPLFPGETRRGGFFGLNSASGPLTQALFPPRLFDGKIPCPLSFREQERPSGRARAPDLFFGGRRAPGHSAGNFLPPSARQGQRQAPFWIKVQGSSAVMMELDSRKPSSVSHRRSPSRRQSPALARGAAFRVKSSAEKPASSPQEESGGSSASAPAVCGNGLFYDPLVQKVHWSTLLLSKLPQKIGLEHNSTSLARRSRRRLFRCEFRNLCTLLGSAPA